MLLLQAMAAHTEAMHRPAATPLARSASTQPRRAATSRCTCLVQAGQHCVIQADLFAGSVEILFKLLRKVTWRKLSKAWQHHVDVLACRLALAMVEAMARLQVCTLATPNSMLKLSCILSSIHQAAAYNATGYVKGLQTDWC